MRQLKFNRMTKKNVTQSPTRQQVPAGREPRDQEERVPELDEQAQRLPRARVEEDDAAHDDAPQQVFSGCLSLSTLFPAGRQEDDTIDMIEMN